MCTVSWLHTENGYDLLCNRDEKHARQPAAPPTIHESGGVRYIAPTDGDGGGTWIAVNEYGLTFALLNRAGVASGGTRSRGHLVTALAGATSLDVVHREMARADLTANAGFRLVALSPARPARLFEWDGQKLQHMHNADHRMPLISSSFDEKGVRVKRLTDFQSHLRANGRLDAATLFNFHRSHGRVCDAPSAYSTCMHRGDARTVSFSWVRVGSDEVRLFYSPDAPCQGIAGRTAVLEREAANCVLCG